MSSNYYIAQYQPTVFLGGFWLDDCQSLEYQYGTPKEPLYGFRDTEFRHIARGQRIVHGMLDINFRHKGYLALAISQLSNLDRFVKTQFFTQNRNPSNGGVLTVREVLHALTESNEFGDGAITTAILDADARESLLTQAFERFDLNGFTRLSDALREDLWDGFAEPIADPLSKESVQKNRPSPGAWPLGFNLTVVYDQQDPGDPQQAQEPTMVETVTDVHIVAQSKQITNQVPGGGHAITERYQFIARSIE